MDTYAKELLWGGNMRESFRKLALALVGRPRQLAAGVVWNQVLRL